MLLDACEAGLCDRFVGSQRLRPRAPLVGRPARGWKREVDRVLHAAPGEVRRNRRKVLPLGRWAAPRSSDTTRPSTSRTHRLAPVAEVGSWVTRPSVMPVATSPRAGARPHWPRPGRGYRSARRPAAPGAHDRGRGRSRPAGAATGELVRAVLGAVRQAIGGEGRRGPLAALRQPQPRQGHRQLDVLGRAQARHQVEELKDEADRSAAREPGRCRRAR